MGLTIKARVREAIIMGFSSCSIEELAARFDLPKREVSAIWGYARQKGVMPKGIGGEWAVRRRMLFLRGSGSPERFAEMMAEVRAWHKPTVTSQAA